MFNDNHYRTEATFANFLLEVFGFIIGILGEIASNMFGGSDTDFTEDEDDECAFGSMFDGIMDVFETSSFSNDFSFTNINHQGGEMIAGMIDDSIIY